MNVLLLPDFENRISTYVLKIIRDGKWTYVWPFSVNSPRNSLKTNKICQEHSWWIVACACMLYNRAGWRPRGRGCRRRWEFAVTQQSPSPFISTTATSPAAHCHLVPARRRPLHHQSSVDSETRRQRRCVPGAGGPDDGSAGCSSRSSILRFPPRSAAERRR